MRPWQLVAFWWVLGCATPGVRTAPTTEPEAPIDAWHMPTMTVTSPAAPPPATSPVTAHTAVATDTPRPVEPPRRLRPRFRSRWPDDPSRACPPPGAALRRIAKQFKRCYANMLKSDPNLRGKVELHVQRHPGGRVKEVRATTDNPTLEFMLPCLQAVVQAATFPPPDGCEDQFVIPILFAPGS